MWVTFVWQIKIDIQFTTITGKSLSEALLFAEYGENMMCTKIVLNVRNNFCPGLSLEFSCIEIVIQLTWSFRVLKL